MSEQGWASAPATKWDDVDTNAPPPLPPGVYGFKVASAEPHMTKAKPGKDHGDPAVKAELTITHKYGDEPTLSRKCFVTLMLVGDGVFRTKQLILALGCDPPESNELDDVESWCEMITGRDGYGQFKQREYTPAGSAEKRIALDVERFLNDETLEQAVTATTGNAPAAETTPRRKGRRAA